MASGAVYWDPYADFIVIRSVLFIILIFLDGLLILAILSSVSALSAAVSDAGLVLINNQISQNS